LDGAQFAKAADFRLQALWVWRAPGEAPSGLLFCAGQAENVDFLAEIR